MKDSQSSPIKKISVFRRVMTQKILASFLALFFVVQLVYVVPPPKTTEAFFSSWGLIIKEYGLDGAANFISQRLLRMITRDTVNWINSGFQGSPGFVQNPGRLAIEAADSAFNVFLSSEDIDLLCSPFRVNIQLALRSQYLGDNPRFRCTIDDVLNNAQAFYRDFNQGGWRGWFTITQTRGNTPFGAYIEAEGELLRRINVNQETLADKLDWGRGILSFDTCVDTTPVQVAVPQFETIQTEFGPINRPTGEVIYESRPRTLQECAPESIQTQTPGTVIEGQLIDVFGSGVAKLEAADEINEIIGALLDQFTIKLFNSAGGLFGLKNKLDDNPGRVISPVTLENALDPEDPTLANYCGSFREGFLPSATLNIGGDATFTTNRRDVTVQPGDVITYSWCGANANQYASSYTVRNDLSNGCADSGTNVPWIAQNGYGVQSATVGAEQIGCAYEITYAARNTAAEDPLTSNLTTQSAESKIIVRVGETRPPVVVGQCTISEVTIDNLAAATTQINQEIGGVANTIGNSIMITSSNGTVQLTPVSPSGVAQSIQTQVANQIGCTETSNLTFVVFQVDNPNQLPPEILNQLGSERPNQILVVLDSVGTQTNNTSFSPSRARSQSFNTTNDPITIATYGNTIPSSSPSPGTSSDGTISLPVSNKVLPQKLGVYHWANNYTGSGNPIADGVDFAAKKGFQTVRLTLSPRYKSDYRIGDQSCTNEPLANIVAKPEWQAALSNPNIKTYILTTYDATTFGDCSTKNYLSSSFFTSQNTTAVENEYKNLAQYLANTYKGTGKRFIISNWETDNDVYCGSAYNYIVDQSFRTACNQNISTWFGANTFGDIFDALTNWFKARERGIAAGEAQVTNGAIVAHAPEFISVDMLPNAGYKDVLHEVITKLNSDYISYSAYDSLNNNSLNADISTIRGLVNKPLIIGEYGYNRSTEGATNAADKLTQVTQTLLNNSQVSIAIIWQLFDQSNGPFGLYNGSGVEQTTGAAIQTFAQ